MPITTAMSATYKRDLMFGRHHHAQPRSFTGTVANGAQTMTAVSALTGLAVGAFISNANLPAGTRISDILSANSIGISKPATGAIAAGTIAMTGDQFKIALIKSGMAGTYDASTQDYSQVTANGDEVVGTAYVAGGQNMTNVDPITSGAAAYTNFSPNPSWVGASFSTAGCMIYNATRNGELATPSTSVHDFGGVQTVAAGTFTAVMPTADAANAILRIT